MIPLTELEHLLTATIQRECEPKRQLDAYRRIKRCVSETVVEYLAHMSAMETLAQHQSDCHEYQDEYGGDWATEMVDFFVFQRLRHLSYN
jgi:hypothetical protein